jgi:hypothetical protein
VRATETERRGILFRLVAIDLDGTLLTTLGTVSDQTMWNDHRVDP